jgi:flagellar biosynthesis protein
MTDKEIDKNKLAVALAYERDKDQAPRVAAKGKGYIAQQIIDLAKKHDIEIREDADLVTLLSKLDIDTPIPLEAYAAVAEILAYVYRANDQMKRKS